MSYYRTGFYFTSKEGKLHIFKRKDKYKGRYKSENWIGRTFVQSKQIDKSSGTDKKTQAKKILETWYEDLQFQIKHDIKIHVKSFKECAKEFARQLDNDNSKASTTKTTLRGRIDLILKNTEFSKLSVNTITLNDINKHVSWYTNRLKKTGHGLDEVRSRTLLGSLNTISNVMSWCVVQKYRKTKLEGITSKILGNKLKHQKTHRTQFTMSEYKHLQTISKQRIKEARGHRLKFEREKLHHFCIFMMNTGLRVDEALSLDWEDIGFHDKDSLKGKKDYYSDIEQKYLRIDVVNSKTGERESIGLGGSYFALQNLMKLYRSKNIEIAGKIWRQNSFREGLNSLLRASGLKEEKLMGRKLTRDSKSFRHSFIQIMLDKGISAMVISKSVGTSVSMIEKYYTANYKIESLIEQMTKLESVERRTKHKHLKLVK